MKIINNIDDIDDIVAYIKKEIYKEYGSYSNFCKTHSISRPQLSSFINMKRQPSITYVLKLFSMLNIDMIINRKENEKDIL